MSVSDEVGHLDKPGRGQTREDGCCLAEDTAAVFEGTSGVGIVAPPPQPAQLPKASLELLLTRWYFAFT